jgi:hypothetical protein
MVTKEIPMKRLIAVLTMSVLSALLVPASKVYAAQSQDNACVVSDVAMVDDTWGRGLFIACTSGNFYYAFISGGNTPADCQLAPNVDWLKMWETIATSSYLSGRTAAVAYDTDTSCGGVGVTKKIIRTLELH